MKTPFKSNNDDDSWRAATGAASLPKDGEDVTDKSASRYSPYKTRSAARKTGTPYKHPYSSVTKENQKPSRASFGSESSSSILSKFAWRSRSSFVSRKPGTKTTGLDASPSPSPSPSGSNTSSYCQVLGTKTPAESNMQPVTIKSENRPKMIITDPTSPAMSSMGSKDGESSPKPPADATTPLGPTPTSEDKSTPPVTKNMRGLVEAVEKDMKTMEKALETARAETKKLNDELSAARAEKEKTEAIIVELKTKNNELNEDLSAARAEKEKTKGIIVELKTKNNELNEDLSAARAKNKEIVIERDAIMKEFTQCQAIAQARLASATSENAYLESRFEMFRENAFRAYEAFRRVWDADDNYDL